MKTEEQIKAMFGDWQAKAAAIPTLPPSVLIGCLANAEHLAVLLGIHELFAEPKTLQDLSPPEQATFVKYMQQIMEYTLEQVRAEIDKRFTTRP